MDALADININIIYAIAIVLAFIVSCVLTPFSKKFAMKVGAIDYPKERGVHTKPMPLAGGTAIVTSFIVVSLLIAPFMEGFVASEFIGLLAGCVIISILGFLDDVYQLSPKIRIFFQLLAALIVVFSGTTIEWISWPWSESGLISLSTLGNFISVLWIVGLTNAVNFLDGLDGLATGVATIASISFMVISFLFGPPVVVVLAAILAGSCLGFLPHNFSPAKIFMGDTGSTFLGFTLAVISIQGLTKSYTVITIIVGAIVLGLPLFDTSFAILRRLKNNQKITQADRGHLHHRLVDKGMSHKKAVLSMYAVSGCFGIAGVLFALQDFLFATLIVATIFIVWIGDLIHVAHKAKTKS